MITLAGVRALHNCDVVITDRLVSPELLQAHVPIGVQIIYSLKLKGRACVAQEELHQWTLKKLAQGLDVVRLKGGDPFLYGRGGEEVEVFRGQGHVVEVVAGLSSSLSGPLCAGIAVTTRGVADQFLVATHHGKKDSIKEAPRYEASRTTVFLMSVSRLAILASDLHEKGYPSSVQVSFVEKASSNQQRRIDATLETCLEVAQAHGVQSPALVVVGKAVHALSEPHQSYFHQGGVFFEPDLVVGA